MTGAEPPRDRGLTLASCCLRVEQVLLTCVLASLLYLFDPGQPYSFLPYSVWPYLGLVIALPLLWVVRARRSGEPFFLDLWDVALVACGAWMGLSTAVGGVEDMDAFLVWESGLLLALYVRRSYRGLGGFRWLLVAAIAILAVEALFSVAQYVTVLGSSPLQERVAGNLFDHMPERYMVGGRGLRLSRATGTFWTANILGGWIVMWVPILLAGWLRLRAAARRTRWPVGLLGAACLFILVRNLARVALAAGMLSVAFLATVTWRRAGGGLQAARRLAVDRQTLAVTAVAIGLAGVYLLGPSGRQFARVVVGKIEQSRAVARVRLSLQADAAGKVGRHLLVGAGHGRNREIMSPMANLLEGEDGRVQQMHRRYRDLQLRAHNLYLMMTLDGGLPATVFFLVALGVCFVLYARRFRLLGAPQDALATSASGFILMSLGYNLAYLPDLWPVFMILLGAFRGCLDAEPVTPATDAGG